MEKIFPAFIAVVLCAAFPAQAQVQAIAEGVQVYDPKIEKEGDNVIVTLRAEVGRKAVGRNHSLVFSPVLTDGHYSWSLPAVVVQGRGAGLLEERHLMASGDEAGVGKALYAANGQTVDYVAEAPYQLWMEGARLEMEAVNVGCCSSSEVTLQVMTEDLVLSPPVAAPEPPAPQVEAPQLSTADELAKSYTFIRPAGEYEEAGSDGIYDEDREDALWINYPKGGSRIVPGQGNNRQSLSDLISSIAAIQNSADSRVRYVVVAGFASPEGSFDLNDRLAWSRAVAVKEYIIDNSALSADMVKLYNGSEDWRGLRILIEQSDRPWKERALDIIDNTPIWDTKRQTGRQSELMRLDGGEPYSYIYSNFYPLLRNAAYIKVYYENK